MSNNSGNIFENPGIKNIEGDDRVRVKKCTQELEVVLQRFDCVLVPQVVITGGNVQGMVRIVAKPRTPTKPQ